MDSIKTWIPDQTYNDNWRTLTDYQKDFLRQRLESDLNLTDMQVMKLIGLKGSFLTMHDWRSQPAFKHCYDIVKSLVRQSLSEEMAQLQETNALLEEQNHNQYLTDGLPLERFRATEYGRNARMRLQQEQKHTGIVQVEIVEHDKLADPTSENTANDKESLE